MKAPWSELEKRRRMNRVILTREFKMRTIERGIFADVEEAISAAIRAIKYTGMFKPALGEAENKWYCLFENKEGDLITIPVKEDKISETCYRSVALTIFRSKWHERKFYKKERLKRGEGDEKISL